MKKCVCILMCVILMFSFCSCGSNIKDAKTRDVSSELYSKEDIDSAIRTIKTEFAFGWRNCTLLEIYYAGDEMTSECQQWAERYGAHEAIVLRSSFRVNKADGAASLNEGAVYDWWNWILVRAEGGRWKHVDHGFI